MWYTFKQNNSGGFFDETEYLGEVVIIEADSDDAAVNKAEDFGLYWNGVGTGEDCKCCGDRWSTFDLEGTEKPEIYGEPAEDFRTFRDYGSIHLYYANGVHKVLRQGDNPDGNN